MTLTDLLFRVVLFSVVLLEVFLRLTTFRGTWNGFPLAPFDRQAPIRAIQGADMTKAYLVFDRDTGWTVGPTRSSQNGLYHSDALGMRMTPASSAPVAITTATTGVELPGSRAFAIAYGDSFTHGDDVPDDATFENALARLTGAPVWNAGVPGYGVDQAWLRYRAQKESLLSDHVIIGFMPDNIARHINRYRPHISPTEGIPFAKPRFLLRASVLELLPQPFTRFEEYKAEDLSPRLGQLTINDDWYRPEAYESRLSDWSRSLRVLRTAQARHETGPQSWRALYERPDAVELTARILRDFAAEVALDRRQALVLVLPDRTVCRDAMAGGARLHDVVIAPLKRSGVKVLDMTDAIVAFLKTQPSDEKFFLPHYSRELNEIVAAELAKKLH